METAFVIWMIGTLPSIGEALCIIALIGIIATFSVGVPCLVEGVHGIKKYLVGAVIVFSILGVIGLVIPNKETAYAMAAGFGIQAIAETPKAQELASDSVDVLSSYLKKAKKDLEQESK